jgi:hypothetical protein
MRDMSLESSDNLRPVLSRTLDVMPVSFILHSAKLPVSKCELAMLAWGCCNVYVHPTWRTRCDEVISTGFTRPRINIDRCAIFADHELVSREIVVY